MTKFLRRFNYTHRVRIPATNVHIDTRMRRDGSCIAIVRRLDLSDFGQHSEATWNAAEVFIEARRRSTESFKRLSLGNVADVRNGSLPKELVVEGFDDDSDIVFRVKVVDGESRLLADGDNINIGEPQNTSKEPLIHLIAAELGEQIWRISWDDVGGPIVEVNKRLPNWSGLLTRDPLSTGLIVPQIVREVLPRAVTADQKTDLWVRKWMEFAKRLGHDDAPDEDELDDIQEWVETVIADFSSTSKFASTAEEFLNKTDDV